MSTITTTFADYLDGLPAWDGKYRLANWIIDLFIEPDVIGDDDEGLDLNYLSTLMLLSPVWRTRKPGCAVETLPVLTGHGGIGKSTALRWLFPSEHRDAWCSSIAAGGFVAPDTVIAEVTVVEVKEGRGVKLPDEQTLAIQSLADRARPIHYAMVATYTDDYGFTLPSSRFSLICLYRRRVEVRPYLDEHREQLWAEAVMLYDQGVEPNYASWFHADENVAGGLGAWEGTHLKERVPGADIMNPVGEWLEQRSGTPTSSFTIEDVMDGCGDRISELHQHRVEAALVHLGYQSFTYWRAVSAP